MLALILIALKPSEPSSSEGETGGASESVVPQIVSTMVVFLLLAGLGAAGPRAQRVSNLLGGLVVLTLAFKNHGNITAAVTGVTTYKTPGTPAGAPSATSAGSATGATPGVSEPGSFAPTPSGNPPLAQQYVSGWRGVYQPLPTPNGQPSTAQRYTGG